MHDDETASGLVSVIVTARNKGPWLADALNSVWNQTWKRIQLIVVDDKSSDTTLDVVGQYSDRIDTFIQVGGRGSAASRNAGLDAARGEYIQFLDGDDLLEANKLSTQIAALRREPRRVAACPCERFRDRRGDWPSSRTQGEAAVLGVTRWAAEKFGVWGTYTHMWLVPREVAMRAGPWNVALSRLADPEYFIRIVLSSDGVVFCPDTVVHYRTGVQGSIAGNLDPESHRSSVASTALCERYIRSVSDSESVRRQFAQRWWVVAETAYPHDLAVFRFALANSRRLGACDRTPSGGRLFSALRPLVGWRLAKRLSLLIYRSRARR